MASWKHYRDRSLGKLGNHCVEQEWGAIAQLLGDRFSVAAGVRDQFARGESFPVSMPPDAVAFPTSTEEVSVIARFCHKEHIPLIASGAGTSLEGNITAPQGGLAVNFSKMDRILDVHDGDLDCLVEAGVTREQLNAHLRDRGLFFPIDPGANASLGGMASTRASGTNAVRYGTMAQNILGLTVVQADGTVMHTGGRARKSAAGYDLTHLFIGSEGTLGLITEVRLRLYGIPEAILAATCAFATLSGAIETVTALIQLGVPVARVEFLDEVQVRACNRYSRLDLPEKPHLFFEFHGSPAAVREQADIAESTALENGGVGFLHAEQVEDRNRLWKARYQAYFAAINLRPNAEVWSSDVCVPISRLNEVVSAVRADIDTHQLLAPIVGHVGDGNFHVLFNLDPEKPAEREIAQAIYHRMIDHALSVGGTCTGEHGIGLNKREHLFEEAGAAAIDAMRSIKHALDPRDILNPGKIFLPA
jgi:D-lactate dehydrogenase (cytochrome)